MVNNYMENKQILGEVGLTFDTKRDKFYVFKHCRIDPKYFGSCNQIKRATKVRPDTLRKMQLRTATTEESLNELEIYYIKILDAVKNPNFYNIAAGGNGGNTHLGWSEEQKKGFSEKISKIIKNRPPSSPETNKKRSQTLMNHYVSPETRQKQSLIKKNKIPLCAINRLRPVNLINTQTKQVLCFNSCEEAGRNLGCSGSLVNMLSSGKLAKIKKYWIIYTV